MKHKWLGLWLMGGAVFAAVAIGVLAFARVLPVETANSAITFCIVVGFLPGFVLHTIAVVKQWRAKQRAKDQR